MYTYVVFFFVLVALFALALLNCYLLVSAFKMYKDMSRVRKDCEAFRNITQNFRDEALHICHRINALQDAKN